MMYEKTKPVRDRPYLDSFKDTPCEACGRNDGTTVPAHFSLGNYALGMKAGDDLVAGLCQSCHDLADGRAGQPGDREWTWLDVLRTVLHKRYQAWLLEKQGR